MAATRWVAPSQRFHDRSAVGGTLPRLWTMQQQVSRAADTTQEACVTVAIPPD